MHTYEDITLQDKHRAQSKIRNTDQTTLFVSLLRIKKILCKKILADTHMFNLQMRCKSKMEKKSENHLQSASCSVVQAGEGSYLSFHQEASELMRDLASIAQIKKSACVCA